ncbi:MAG: HEAT repeat domain-containing protein [Gemmatimonadales bacterium]
MPLRIHNVAGDLMGRRRRRDPSRTWREQVEFVFLKPRNPTTPSERRWGLLQAILLLFLFVGVPAAVFIALSERGHLGFDQRSPDAWVHALTTGDTTARAEMVLLLGETEQVTHIPCNVLGGLLADSDDVRSAAVPTLANAVRAGHCLDVVLGVLATGHTPASREAAARVIARAGAAVQPLATEPLLRALRTDSATRQATLAALGALDDTTEYVRHELEEVFRQDHGPVRASVLEALTRLGLPAARLEPIALIALLDRDPSVRVEAINALEALAADERVRARVIPPLLPSLHDREPAVRVDAIRVLGRLAPSLPRVDSALHAAARDSNAAIRAAASEALSRPRDDPPR